MSVNSRLKATKIIGQRKAFYRHRIPESGCARKETVDIDILVTSRNGDRKVMLLKFMFFNIHCFQVNHSFIAIALSSSHKKLMKVKVRAVIKSK